MKRLRLSMNCFGELDEREEHGYCERRDGDENEDEPH